MLNTDEPHDINSNCFVRFEVFSAVTMKNVVFWDIINPVRTSQETLRLRNRAQPVNAM
jgi:hypothetical protein